MEELNITPRMSVGVSQGARSLLQCLIPLQSLSVSLNNIPLPSPLTLVPPPFSPSLISLMVSVDVKHHVYLLTSPSTGVTPTYLLQSLIPLALLSLSPSTGVTPTYPLQPLMPLLSPSSSTGVTPTYLQQ